VTGDEWPSASGGARSLRSDGHNLARGLLAPLPHLVHEELREFAAALEHRARGSVHQPSRRAAFIHLAVITPRDDGVC
jgi:hypothetical protein